VTHHWNTGTLSKGWLLLTAVSILNHERSKSKQEPGACENYQMDFEFGGMKRRKESLCCAATGPLFRSEPSTLCTVVPKLPVRPEGSGGNRKVFSGTHFVNPILNAAL
jgi:hypothetical protein